MSKPKRATLAFPIRLKSQAELATLMATGVLAGHAVHLLVLHDEWCPGEPCRCSPEYVVEELTAENYTEGQRKQHEWQQGKRS